MGIKKIARPMNKAKNDFVKWLKDNNADNIHIFEGEKSDWDYYRSISGFIGGILYTVNFMVWNGEESISYTDPENRFKGMTIDDLLQMII